MTNPTVAVTAATGRLLRVTDALLIAQGSFDLTWSPLVDAADACERFVINNPDISVDDLVCDLDTSTTALQAQVDWEAP